MARRNITKAVWTQLAVVTLFALAMAYLESAVVIYLRALFHVSGNLITFTPSRTSVWFSVPYFTLLKPAALSRVLPRASISSIEVAREVATVVMLVCLAWLAGRDWKARSAFFLYAFAVWDLGYYAFLRALIGWPTSFKSLDVLFLIPGPWIAPVWVPIAISVAMIAIALVLLGTGRSARTRT